MRNLVPFGVLGHLSVDLPTRRPTRLPLVGVSVFLRVLSTLTVPDIWFPGSASTLLSLVLAVFRLTPSPLFQRKVAHPLTNFRPSSETLSGAACCTHHSVLQ